ncbi:hypothetical protein [Cellulomonas sp. URHB0016]
MTEPPTLPQPRIFTPTWLAPADVKAWLRINDQDADDDDLVVRCCAMTEIYAARCRPEFTDLTVDPAVYEPDAETYQGAVMYAAREVRRRNSPAGLQAFADGQVSFVARYDSDIERALRTGAWTRPGVG